LSTVRIEANSVIDVAFGVVFDVAADASIRDVVASENTWSVGREIYRAEERVDGLTAD
jgi:nitrous oxidase accessory protein NosD